MYPVEEMTYKMKFIMDKLNNKEELTKEEETYAKKINSFMKVYDALCLEKQFEAVEIEKAAIRELLYKKRKELIKVIRGTKSASKLKVLREQVLNIEEFLHSEAVDYFKYLLMDHHEIPMVDIKEIFDSLARRDEYLYNPCLAQDRRYNQLSPFINWNHYTNEVTFNRPLIDLTRLVISRDLTIYNALEKRTDLLEQRKEVPSDIEDIIPDEMKDIRIKDISAIINYGNGRIGTNDNEFVTLKDDLDILVAVDNALKGDIKEADDALIKESIGNVIKGVITGKYKVSDFTGYKVLKYFEDGVDTRRFRDILRSNKFDIDLVQKHILTDDLLRKTALYREENLFVNDDGELNLANISLASSVINGEDINDEEALDADPNCLERIKYYKPAHRNNVHDYEIDKYDVKVLLAIARYKEDLKKKLMVDENKALS